MKPLKTCNPFPPAGYVSFATPALAALAVQHWQNDHKYQVGPNAEWQNAIWGNGAIINLMFNEHSGSIDWFNCIKQPLHISNLNDLKQLLWGPAIKVIGAGINKATIDPITRQVTIESPGTPGNRIMLSFEQCQTIVDALTLSKNKRKWNSLHNQ